MSNRAGRSKREISPLWMESMRIALLRIDAVLSIFFDALKPFAHKFSARRIRRLDASGLAVGVISRTSAARGHRKRFVRLRLHAAHFANCAR
jgi:hypothetical protein